MGLNSASQDEDSAHFCPLYSMATLVSTIISINLSVAAQHFWQAEVEACKV